MKTKKLTINALAGSNLKKRKKQYIIMFVGIILAMVFSSSIVLYLFSSNETYLQQAKEKYGAQDAIIYSYNNDESDFQKAKNDGAITDYALGHIIGYAYLEEDEASMGMSVGWLEDKAKELSHQSLLEGEYPVKENEIAVEKSALFKLGIDAKVGDNITLKVKTQNNDEYLSAKEKTYKLVGILSNKRGNVQNERFNESDCIDMPAGFVADGTETELGGKEKLVAYVNSDMTDGVYEKSVWSYLDDNGFRHISTNVSPYAFDSLGSISENSYLMIVIVLVLVFASCVAIVNSFNTNLKERKKQIGMMRAVGTTKRQIIQIFGRESFIISLICVPISIALSYGIVWGVITLSNEKAVMTKSIVVLPVCAVVCLVVTMLASLLPLLSASKITPMQAIRDIDNTRKMKTKKIKSKKAFKVSSHLAKRNLTFYKGGLIAVSIILSITIMFSCLCFSWLSGVRNDIGTLGMDYEVSSLGGGYSTFGYDNYAGGMSDADKQSIASMPYVAEANGNKTVVAAVEMDEITNFDKVMINYPIYDYDDDDLSYENFEEKHYTKFTESYLDFKKEYGLKNEFVPIDIYGQETEELELLNSYVTDGKININKIASGDEVVLVAPNKVKETLRIDKDGHGGYGSGPIYDDGVIPKDYQVIFEAENPYKVGDKLKLTTVMINESTGKTQILKKETVIGAIVNPTALYDAREKENRSFNCEHFSLVTTNAGIHNFCKSVKYGRVEVNADRELDEETDKLLIDSLTELADKYEGYVRSDYAHKQSQQQAWVKVLVSVLSIVLVGFTVCASIVNNTLTASIREKKRTIGTLRAVGASEGDIVTSFIKQLLSIFKWGYGVGFSLFVVVYFMLYAHFKYQQINELTGAESFYLPFSPWITIVFCLVLFGICSLNLWAKIRKEMKNSIIDNIREL
ncbi:MAG: ABC transporter permease [Eubacterium sp.]|nr:ABC transporter permease [Eubacterium sp.]